MTETETKTYSGGCHCGKVRYEVTGKFDKAMSCNCSICSKTGALLGFVPDAGFKLLSGEGALTDYQFAKKNVHHLFCSTCGIRSFATGTGPGGKKMYMVSLRCLDDFDADALPIERFDGKSL
jgi:hypothetical protein